MALMFTLLAVFASDLSSSDSSLHSYPGSLHPNQTSFTIAMDDAYDHKILGDVNPDDLYQEVFCHTKEILTILRENTLTPDQELAMDDYLVETLAKLVFGSNMIENAGAGWDITLKLCQAIFRGEAIPNDIGERDEEYVKIKENLLRRNLPSGTQYVLKSRREIIQHAKAVSYMIIEIYLRDKDLTEEIILETHRILTYMIDTEHGASWMAYSGVYRRQNVTAGGIQFTDAAVVDLAMSSMISSMNEDIEEAKESGKIDPVSFSTKYCHEFVNIHPFLDGNGRMCRLILNTLLLKYGGNLVCIGEQGDDREAYLGIAKRSTEREWLQLYEEEDEEEDAKPNYSELASFTLHRFTDNMRKLAGILKDQGGKKGGK